MYNIDVPEKLKGVCDVFVETKGKKIEILQITDMQIIDSAQRPYLARLRPIEVERYATENIERNCFLRIKSLVAQLKPDVIMMTGDLVYGEFDASGASHRKLVEFMESLDIPWAPIFGNHDSETAKGVKWQCELYENAKNCLFKEGNCTGHGNYTVGIINNGELVRILYMLDSHGCDFASDEDNKIQEGIFEDQIEMIKETARRAEEVCGRKIPAFAAYHIPNPVFTRAADAKGYSALNKYTIGVDVEAKDGDFGCKGSDKNSYDTTTEVPNYVEKLKEANVDGVFVGHTHKINTSISYEGIQWTYGLKTGISDGYTIGQLGGTSIRVDEGGKDFEIRHVPCLVPYEHEI